MREVRSRPASREARPTSRSACAIGAYFGAEYTFIFEESSVSSSQYKPLSLNTGTVIVARSQEMSVGVPPATGYLRSTPRLVGVDFGARYTKFPSGMLTSTGPSGRSQTFMKEPPASGIR